MKCPVFCALSLLLAGCGGPSSDEETVLTGRWLLTIENISPVEGVPTSQGENYVVGFSPGVWLVHSDARILFSTDRLASAELEALAETGNPEPLVQALGENEHVISKGLLQPQDTTTYEDGPLLPTSRVETSIVAPLNARLSLALMFGESNDVFAASEPSGIPFANSDGTPRDGDITAQLKLWDAGTELNEEPGLGQYQPARQTSIDAGEPESTPPAELIDDMDVLGHSYPALAESLRVTLTFVGEE